jgi:hypothetical protein
LAKERVRTSVLEGEHNIEVEVIERRYYRGVQNLFEIYFNIVDDLLIFDNSFGKNELIVRRKFHEKPNVLNESKFSELKKIMSYQDEQEELFDKIIKGMDKVYEKLIEYKNRKNRFGYYVRW